MMTFQVCNPQSQVMLQSLQMPNPPCSRRVKRHSWSHGSIRTSPRQDAFLQPESKKKLSPKSKFFKRGTPQLSYPNCIPVNVEARKPSVNISTRPSANPARSSLFSSTIMRHLSQGAPRHQSVHCAPTESQDFDTDIHYIGNELWDVANFETVDLGRNDFENLMKYFGIPEEHITSVAPIPNTMPYVPVSVYEDVDADLDNELDACFEELIGSPTLSDQSFVESPVNDFSDVLSSMNTLDIGGSDN